MCGRNQEDLEHFEHRRQVYLRSIQRGPAGTTPINHHPLRIVRREHNKNVIYEYNNGQRCSTTTFPSKHHQYYRVGDFIALAELPLQWIERLYPEIRGADSNGVSLVDIAMFWLGEAPPKYKTGFKITQIRPVEQNGGGISATAVILFHGEGALNAVELSTTRQWNYEQLNGDFTRWRNARRHIEGAGLLDLYGGFLSLLLSASTGGGSSIIRYGVRGGSRRIIRYGFRQAATRAARGTWARIIRLITAQFTQVFLSAVQAGARAFATQYTTHRNQQNLRTRTNAQPLRVSDLNFATEAAITAFVSTLITGAITLGLNQGSTASSNDSLNIPQSAIDHLIRVVKPRVRNFLIGPAWVSMINSILTSERTARDNGERVALPDLEEMIKSTLLSLLRNQTGQLLEGVRPPV